MSMIAGPAIVRNRVTAKAEAKMIPITTDYFPDSNFCRYVLNNFDKDDDGFLSESEAKSVGTIDLKGTGVMYLKGIEYFEGLTVLDVSGLEITSLTVPKPNTTWTSFINSYSLKKNIANDMPNIEYLHAPEFNKLSSVEMKNCPKLYDVRIACCALTSVDFSGSYGLKNLLLFDNELESIDISDLTELEELVVSDNNITSLDVSNNTKLNKLDVSKNENFDLDGLCSSESIKMLCVDKIGISSIDIAKYPNIEYLDCENNNLSKIDLSNCKNLVTLYCGYNDLRRIDVSKCVTLKKLSIKACNLSSIGDCAFRAASNMKNISIASTVTKIGYGAFIESAIESIVIPDSVDTISAFAFADCENL